MASGYQIAGLTAEMEPSGRWYDLEVCDKVEDGSFSVKVADTEVARKVGMAGQVAEGVDERFIREKPATEDEEKEKVDSNGVAEAEVEKTPSASATPKVEEKGKEQTFVPRMESRSNADIGHIQTTVTKNTAATTVKIFEVENKTNGESKAKRRGEVVRITSEELGKIPKEEIIKRFLAEQDRRIDAEEKAELLEENNASWQQGVRDILNCIILSPVMNHFYKKKLSVTLEKVFLAVNSITLVQYIHCSFPSIQAEFPKIELLTWSGLARSHWKVSWSPSWRIKARVEGSHYLSFTLNITIHKLSVQGEFYLNCAKDLSSIEISFLKLPQVSLDINTTIALGILPISLSILQDSISSRIKNAFINYLKDKLVHPNSLSIPCLRRNNAATEEAILDEAKAAAKLARHKSLSEI
mmetsp:Transcript_12612/g.18868  ORF Transcript_12612/g.18868 Transcript_12612/m.18868 type:complete len:412 (-) Transcript_12612:204-1439(-)